MISEETIDKVGAALADTWRLGPTDAARLLGFGDRAERLVYLLDIRCLLAGLFRNEDTENRWLREPLRHLTDASPIQLMTSKSVAELQTVDGYVRHISGL